MAMTIRTLKSMFNPASITILGQGTDDESVDALLERNLINAGFQGRVLPSFYVPPLPMV
ncbi:MAG TPA: hypothetical protein VJ608_08080 [Albitalea sp.]|nr:hypothetical protein [Albitalea sp.]